MKQIIIMLLAIFAFVNVSKAQKVEFYQNFENLEKGQDIKMLQKGKFGTWGKSIWTVSEKKGKGFNKSDKYASSSGEVNATLVQYKNLEVGATYVFSVVVKVSNTGGKDFKGNYAVKVVSGKKGDIHFYGDEQIKNPNPNNWEQHQIEFTVVEGRDRVVLQVYRWAKEIVLSVDDFKLIKK